MAYTANVTSPMKNAERISRNIGLYAGKVDITSYNTTLIEITAITRYFKTGGVAGFTKGLIAVVCPGMSDQGFSFEWDYTTGAFKAYKPTRIVVIDSTGGTAMEIVDGSIAATAAASTITSQAAEAADDNDAGESGFVAVGFV